LGEWGISCSFDIAQWHSKDNALDVAAIEDCVY
jgi:hypothetical protein